jgi:prolipoprotein diacylglyceryltransferase
MPLASLPGPVSERWHLWVVTVHGYALCVVLGIVVALWITELRYRAVGGRRWLIADMATVVVPAGLICARMYQVVTDFGRYFGHGRDWVNILRIWEGGLGVPGAAAGALIAAVIWCRRTETGTGPVFCAAVPALAFGQAIAVLGNWFAQSLYGSPTTLPWAVAIAPRNRVSGYQDFGTFQPLFIYESLWLVLVGFALLRLIRRYRMTGQQALAACAGLYAAGQIVTVSLLLTDPLRRSGVITDEVASAVVIAVAAAYLFLTRQQHGPQPLTTTASRRGQRAEDSAGDQVATEVPGDQVTLGLLVEIRLAGHGVPRVGFEPTLDGF